MKTLIAALAILAVSSTAFAVNVDITKVGQRAWSSATNVTCSISGAKRLAYSDANGSHPVQGHSPNASLTRVKVLGTKGYYNYSTNLAAGDVKQAKISCYNSSTGAAVRVKFYLNGVETYFYVGDSLDIAIQ